MSRTEEPTAVTGTEQGTISCPKCGFVQRRSTECIRCGVIFSKVAQPSGDQELQTGVEEPPARAHYRFATPNRAWLLFLLLVLVAFGAYRFWDSLGVRYPPGILVPSEPRQVVLKTPRPWKKDNRVVVPMAAFSLRARVLGKEGYRHDPTSDVSPFDLVLGWGPMSDQGILDSLDITQGSRCFMMTPLSPGPPLPVSLLMEYCANMHMIPADAEIEKALKRLRTGEVIELRGHLVGIREGGRWVWVSSLTRKDVGNGACEIVWVETLRVLDDVRPSTEITALDSRRNLAR